MNHEEDLKYGKMFADFLVDCCLYYELAAARKSNKEFDDMVKQLYENWDKFTHHHKHIIKKEDLVEPGFGYRLKYPSIVRSLACGIAKNRVNNPMSGRDDRFINSYVVSKIPPVIMA